MARFLEQLSSNPEQFGFSAAALGPLDEALALLIKSFVGRETSNQPGVTSILESVLASSDNDRVDAQQRSFPLEGLLGDVLARNNPDSGLGGILGSLMGGDHSGGESIRGLPADSSILGTLPGDNPTKD